MRAEKSLTLGAMFHVTPVGDEDAIRTYQRFTDLAVSLETIGYEEAWVTEHHFNAYSLTPVPTLLMSHFLANTRRLKLGAAAVLVGFHNPINVAEQLATLSALAPGRVLCGFAKGGPFESQNAVFKAEQSESRERMNEAVPAMLDLLKGETVTHPGHFYQWDNVDLTPKGGFSHREAFIASADESSLTMAARQDVGLMAAQFWDLERIERNAGVYRQAHPKSARPDLMAARGLFMDDDPAQARRLAWQHIESFRAQKAQLWGKGQGPMAKLSPDELLQRMLVGTPQDIVGQVLALHRAGVTRLALNPLTSSPEQRLKQFEWFVLAVWPQVQAALSGDLSARHST